MPRFVRRNIYKMTLTEWNTFATALDGVKVAGNYDPLVQVHQQAMNLKLDTPGDPSDPSASVPTRFKRNAAHRGPSFLPWHRRFLQELESLLPTGTSVPYWPWETDSGAEASADVWTTAYTGSVDSSGEIQDGPFASWNPTLWTGSGFFTDSRPIRRSLGPTGAGYFASQSQIDHVLTYTSYDSSPWFTNSASVGFRNRLEGFLSLSTDPSAALSQMHNAVHIWVGGDMGPGTSPNDPIFFLHHCNIDRIWAKWQELRRHATGLDYPAHYLPVSGGAPGHNRGDTMFPWQTGAGATRVDEMLDLKAQEFVYDDVPIVSLRSSTIDFGQVIDAETSHAAAVFDVISAFPVEFTLQSVSGPDASFFTNPLSGSLESKAVPDPVELEAIGYGWVAYQGEASPTTRNATAVIRAELRDPFDDALLWQRDFTLAITAESIARPTTAVSLVLDQSNSMSSPSGFPSKTRMDVLQFSAPPFVELLGVGNGIGIVAFDQDAYERMPVGAMPAGESTALGHISSHTHNPMGNTSIADGISRARTQLGLSTVVADYDESAVVVLTDGYETAPGWLDDLPASAIGERIYAIGLGKESAIRPEKLQQVVNGASDGYLLLTGELDAGTDTFLLSKYFLKILAGVRNLEIGRDPEGSVTVGAVVRVPFELSEADIAAEVILLTVYPVIDMALESPDGAIIDQSIAASLAGVQHVEGQAMQAYRVSLPVPTNVGPAQAGKWHAVLRLDPRRIKVWLRKRYQDLLKNDAALVASHLGMSAAAAAQAQVEEELRRIAKLGAAYSLNVALRTNLKMTSRIHQTGFDLGSEMRLRVRLTEYRQPVAMRARVRANLCRPDNSRLELGLDEVEPGGFEAIVSGTMPGVWRYQIVANGRTLYGRDFEREDLLTGWIKDPARSDDDPRDRDRPRDGSGGCDLCAIAKCVLADPGMARWLEKQGVDIRSLRRCIERACRGDDAEASSKLEDLRKVLEDALERLGGA